MGYLASRRNVLKPWIHEELLRNPMEMAFPNDRICSIADLVSEREFVRMARAQYRWVSCDGMRDKLNNKAILYTAANHLFELPLLDTNDTGSLIYGAELLVRQKTMTDVVIGAESIAFYSAGRMGFKLRNKMTEVISPLLDYAECVFGKKVDDKLLKSTILYEDSSLVKKIQKSKVIRDKLFMNWEDLDEVIRVFVDAHLNGVDFD